MDDKISIVIPTHDRDNLLKKAIQSVLNQTYKNIEIIVIDDASECDNKSVVENFDMSIIYYKFKTNQGGNICRNKGAKLATGGYIAYLDDDDTWHKDKLEKQLRLMQEKNLDLSYTGKNIITLNPFFEELHRKYSFGKPSYTNNLKKSIMSKNFIGTTSSIMIKKEKFDEVSGFDIRMPALQDYEFYIRFINKGFNAVGIDEPLVDYYIYQKKSAISKSSTKYFNAYKLILKKNRTQGYFYLLRIRFIKSILKRLLKKLAHSHF